MFSRIIYIFFIFLLAGCQTLPKAPHLPQQAETFRSFKLEQRQPLQQVFLLNVQIEPNQWRWVQTDPLGVPAARLLLNQNGSWENDGFLPPNRQAQWLFTAIASSRYFQPPLIDVEIQNVAPEHEIHHKGNNKLWEMRLLSDGIIIRLNDNSEWHLNEL